jgi:hypothetical protein
LIYAFARIAISLTPDLDAPPSLMLLIIFFIGEGIEEESTNFHESSSGILIVFACYNLGG